MQAIRCGRVCAGCLACGLAQRLGYACQVPAQILHDGHGGSELMDIAQRREAQLPNLSAAGREECGEGTSCLVEREAGEPAFGPEVAPGLLG